MTKKESYMYILRQTLILLVLIFAQFTSVFNKWYFLTWLFCALGVLVVLCTKIRLDKDLKEKQAKMKERTKIDLNK